MERAVPILPADDLAIAKRFYAALGFTVTFEATSDGKSGIMGVERGTIALTIDAPMTGHGRDACVSLHVDDADAYYREWSPLISIPKPPRDEEWNARTFGFSDPSGNTIFVIGPAK
jgi:predicted enzyme related to lactoylglutathione lyase